MVRVLFPVPIVYLALKHAAPLLLGYLLPLVTADAGRAPGREPGTYLATPTLRAPPRTPNPSTEVLGSTCT